MIAHLRIDKDVNIVAVSVQCQQVQKDSYVFRIPEKDLVV